jgi:hypothetical protein
MKNSVTIQVPGISDALNGPIQQDSWRQRRSSSAQDTKPETLLETHDTSGFVRAVLKREPKQVHGASHRTFSGIGGVVTRYSAEQLGSGASLLLRGLHSAFGLHQGIALDPAVLWYTVLSETGKFVGLNAELCAPIFGGAAGGKRELHVRDDSVRMGDPTFDWTETLMKYQPMLEKEIPDSAGFFPAFTGLQRQEQLALLVGVMDCAQSFYKYTGSTMCGIPRVELQGEVTDWETLRNAIAGLGEKFKGLPIQPYYDNLLPVIEKIVEARKGGPVDKQFWSSIYKYQSESGGPTVDGWITMFVAHEGIYPDKVGLRALKPWGEQYGYTIVTRTAPSHLSSVPVLWNYYGNETRLTLVGGITGLDYDAARKMIRPSLGWMLVDGE